MQLKWLEEGAMVDGVHVSDDSVGVDRPEYLVHHEPRDSATVFFDGGRAQHFRANIWVVLYDNGESDLSPWDSLYDRYELYSVAGVA